MFKSSSLKNIGKSIIEPSLNYKKYFNEAKLLYEQEERKNFKKNNSSSNIFTSRNSNSSSFYSNNFVLPSFDPEKFNLNKKIKEIQRETKTNNILDIINRKNTRISFSKENINYVAESSQLLQNIKKQKTEEYNRDDNSILKFLSENKEIYIKNLLIKILKIENEKLIKIEDSKGKEIEFQKKNYLKDINYFNDYINQQKKACKEIESILSDIEKKNKILFEEEKQYKFKIKIVEDEIKNCLEHIDDFRICALFVNKVLQKDTSKYEKKIFQFERKLNNKIDKIKIQKKIKEYIDIIIKNYGFILEDNNNSILNEENTFYNKYENLENKILKKIKENQEALNDIRNIKINKEINLKEIKERFLLLEKEEKTLKKEYQRKLEDFKNINPFYNTLDVSYLIINLNNALMQNVLNIKNNKLRKDMRIIDFAIECIEIIKSTELKVNSLIELMETFEKENSVLFNTVTTQRKNEVKEIKQQIAKAKLEEMRLEKKLIAERRLERVVVKSRKTEAPFQIVKRNKNIILDTETLRKEEENQLLNF